MTQLEVLATVMPQHNATSRRSTLLRRSPQRRTRSRRVRLAACEPAALRHVLTYRRGSPDPTVILPGVLLASSFLSAFVQVDSSCQHSRRRSGGMAETT